MIPLTGQQGCLILCGVAALVCGVIGWQLNGWRMSGQIERLRATQTASLATAERDRADAEAKYRQAEKDAADQIAAIADNFHQELAHAQTENDRLRADVDAGARRLRVRASCPAASSSVPADASATSSIDAIAAELDPASRPDYFALRADAERVEQQIAGLQAYARQCYLLRAQAH